MADIEIQVAVAVQVGERRRGRPVAIAAQARLARHVLEPPIALVAIECVRMPARDEQVGPAVVVVVADRDSVAVTPRKRGDARASVTSSNVPSPRLRNKRSPSPPAESVGGKRPPLNGVDVEPAVAVVVEQADAPAHRSRAEAGCCAV